jgi:hypothetical protein
MNIGARAYRIKNSFEFRSSTEVKAKETIMDLMSLLFSALVSGVSGLSQPGLDPPPRCQVLAIRHSGDDFLPRGAEVGDALARSLSACNEGKAAMKHIRSTLSKSAPGAAVDTFMAKLNDKLYELYEKPDRLPSIDTGISIAAAQLVDEMLSSHDMRDKAVASVAAFSLTGQHDAARKFARQVKQMGISWR